MTPRYSVHLQGSGWSHGYVTVDTFAQAVEAFRQFLAGTMSTEASAMLYPYDERDNCVMTFGDYPLAAWGVGPRGGIVRQSI